MKTNSNSVPGRRVIQQFDFSLVVNSGHARLVWLYEVWRQILAETPTLRGYQDVSREETVEAVEAIMNTPHNLLTEKELKKWLTAVFPKRKSVRVFSNGEVGFDDS